MFEGFKQRFSEKVGDEFFSTAAQMYWALNPFKKTTYIFRESDGFWRVKSNGSMVYTPSPKGVYPLLNIDPGYQGSVEVGEGDTVLDLGACIGSFALNVFDRVERVVAVEPDLDNFKCLNRNVKYLKGVNTVLGGVWSETGFIDLGEGKRFSAHSMVSDNDSLKGRVFVYSLNDLVEEIGGSIDFVKMDVEGAELEVIKGGKKALKDVDKVVVAAYHEVNGAPTAKRVSRELQKLGFETKIDEELLVHGSREGF